MMKTVFVKAPFQFKIKEIPIPQPAAGEVLLRVKACGICGSDLHIARSQAADWVTFGHEMTGVIEQTGPGVRHVRPGQRVAVESGSFCGVCEQCRNGRVDLCTKGYNNAQLKINGFSEYMVLPEQCIVPLDPAISFVDGTLLEPLGVAVDLVKTADIRLNDHVLVIGLGPIGLMAARLAKAAGARVYAAQHSDRSARRISLARALGVEDVVITGRTPLSNYPFPRGGVDHILVTAPPKVIPDLIESASFGGVISFLGIDYGPDRMITFDANAFHFKKLQLRASFAAPALYFPMCTELIKTGVIDPKQFITHIFAMNEIAPVMQSLRDGGSEIKAVMDMELV